MWTRDNHASTLTHVALAAMSSPASTMIVRWIRLPRHEKRLFAEAWLAVASARVSVRVLPFRTNYAIARRLAATARKRSVDDPETQLLARAVRRAARFVPGATCLPQALAGYVLFARHGAPCAIRIGVRKSADRALEAHAWLEREGRVVVGGPVSPEFVPFPSLDQLDDDVARAAKRERNNVV